MQRAELKPSAGRHYHACGDVHGSGVNTTGSDTGLAVVFTSPPVITGAVAGQTITDKQTDHPFSGVTIGDPNVGVSETLTVTLDDAANGALSNLGGGSYNGAIVGAS